MTNDDVSHLWNDAPVSAQLFGTWGGQLAAMKRDKQGELRASNSCLH